MKDELLGRLIETTDANLGQSITLSLPQLYHIHSEVCRILDAETLLRHPRMQQELSEVDRNLQSWRAGVLGTFPPKPE